MAKRTGRGRHRTPQPRRAARPTRAGALQRASESSANEAGSFRNPLARLIDTPHLARVVPHLPPETLHQLMRHYGLDACGDIVAAATPAQLTTIFDLDLWRSPQPGREERFDVERFGEWLELLADTGGTGAARTVATMDDQLLTAGLSRYIRVFDPAAIAESTSSDGEAIDIDVTPHAGPECELGGYLVRAIRADGWDAVVALLLALDADCPDRFHAVMRECRRLSNSRPEIDGLDDLLMEPEQLLHDVALDRERRRSQLGYITPADARAFLLMARRRRRPSRGEPSVNPIAAAYFRAGSDTAASGNDHAQDLTRLTLAPPATAAGVPETFDALIDVLATAGLMPQRPRALLEGNESQPERYACIQALMEYVRDNDDASYVVRSQELAFLANALMAGCSIQSRSFTSQEASDAAAGVCNLGLEHWITNGSVTHATPSAALDVTLPDTFLMDHDLVSVFEVGWTVLYENVCMFAAERLLVALSNVRCSDADIQKELGTLRIELTRQCQEGTPWRARNALDVIAMLDMPAWVSVLGLLDECPVMPAALMATLERRTGAISATDFEFISTSSQLGSVREFMTRFLDIVSR
jgi:Family of unknown function (DUF6178)